MKKHFIMLTILMCACYFLYGCSSFTANETPTPDSSPTTTYEVNPTPDASPSPSETPKPLPSPTENNEETYPTHHWEFDKYRPIYYDLNVFFANLVGDEAIDEWQFSRTREEYENECIAVSFIKHFNIAREDFEKANEETRVFREEHESSDSPSFELYPVDLIYTFDNERINEYFLWLDGPYKYSDMLEVSMVTLNAPAKKVLEILGEPLEEKTTTEENLHHWDTLLDYHYTLVYENFELELMTVVRTDGPEPDTIEKDFGVIRVTTTDENHPTARGIRVGDSVEKMFTIYGTREVYSSGYFRYEINSESAYMSFAYKDGRITEISYSISYH